MSADEKMRLKEFLERLGYLRFYERFVEAEVDLVRSAHTSDVFSSLSLPFIGHRSLQACRVQHALTILQEADLAELGVAKGPRKIVTLLD